MIDDEVVLVWLARETGVLDALLSSADTPAQVSRETGVPERTARILTRSLAREGFFDRVDGGYEPTNRALGFLTRTDPRSVGSLPHRADLLDRYLSVADAVADGNPELPSAPEHWTANRLGAVAATDAATVRALVTSAVRATPDAERVIDVGGAPGTFAREFVDRGYEVTLCAESQAAERSRAFLASEPVQVVERSIPPEDPLPGADLAFVPDLTHRLGIRENRDLLAAVADALESGGTVVLVDRVRGRSSGETATALEALATTEAGDVYPADRYREWLTDAGFADPEVRDVPGTDRQAIVGSLATGDGAGDS